MQTKHIYELFMISFSPEIVELACKFVYFQS